MPQWRTLRAEVMRQHHNECVMCRQAGKITKATTVHHVYHVKEYPQYALSQYIYKDGVRIVNLIPLCDGCHNREHPEKFDKHRKNIEKTQKCGLLSIDFHSII